MYASAYISHVYDMEGYKSLDVWKLAHKLTIEVLRNTDAEKRQRSWGFFERARKTAVSVEANIVEGYTLNTAGILHRHLRIAIGSLAEVECLTQTAGEMQYPPSAASSQVLAIVDETLPLLVGLFKSCSRRRRNS